LLDDPEAQKLIDYLEFRKQYKFGIQLEVIVKMNIQDYYGQNWAGIDTEKNGKLGNAEQRPPCFLFKHKYLIRK
jgi:hypothetical protein